MWRKISLVVVGVVLLAVPEKIAEAQQSKGKVYAIYLHSAGRGDASYTLENIETVKFEGMECIKGRFALKENWLEGKNVYIPKDKIEVIAEFDTIGEYKSAVKKHYQKQYE